MSFCSSMATGRQTRKRPLFLLAEIHRGSDLVIGVRENPAPGAMTFTQRWGNACLCADAPSVGRTCARSGAVPGDPP